MRAGRALVRGAVCAAMLMMLLLAAPAFGAGVEYPLPGHFEVEEGTLELWITPQAALYPALEGEKEFRSIMPLFSLVVPDHFSANGGWIAKSTAKGMQHGMHISMNSAAGDGSLFSIPAPTIQWQDKEREPHHLAFTWKGKVMKLYADGIEVGGRNQARGFDGKVAGQKIVIGEERNKGTPVILHAVRFSNVARSEAALPGAKPVLDVNTLLLDRFDSAGKIDAEGRTKAELVSGLSGETGGVIRGTYVFIEKPLPGILLSKEIQAKE